MSNYVLFSAHRRHNEAMALAQNWAKRLGQMIHAARNGMEPEVEIDWTEEGDWSLSVESGSHIYMVHPTDQTYRTFDVLRQTWEGIEVLARGVSLEEAVGRVA